MTGGKANVQQSPRRIEALLGLPIVAVTTSEYHALCITAHGRLFAWGGGRGGRLGTGDEQTRVLPTVSGALETRRVVALLQQSIIAWLLRMRANYTLGVASSGQPATISIPSLNRQQPLQQGRQ